MSNSSYTWLFLFPFSISYFYQSFSSGLACVVLCVVSFSVWFFPILILSVVVANPIAKRTREMLRIETGSITLLLSLACRSWVHWLLSIRKVTHCSLWDRTMRRGQISVLVSWVVNTFLKETDNRRYDFPVVWDLSQASKANSMEPSFLDLNRFILEVEVVSVPLSHPDHHFTSSPNPWGIKKSCCALFTTALHCVVTAVSHS